MNGRPSRQADGEAAAGTRAAGGRQGAAFTHRQQRRRAGSQAGAAWGRALRREAAARRDGWG